VIIIVLEIYGPIDWEHVLMSDINPLVNIITRTHRPEYFAVLEESILSQTYQNINHLMCVDDEDSLKYIKDYSHILVEKKVMGLDGSFPYNLYFNEAYDHIKDGWVLFLDDDDKFFTSGSLDILVSHIRKHPRNTLFLWNVWFPDCGCTIPRYCFGKEPVQCDISGIGFCFHSKYLKEAIWDENKEADYRVIKKLYDFLPNRVWISDILTRLQVGQHYGK